MRLHSFRPHLDLLDRMGVPPVYHGGMLANFIREMERYHHRGFGHWVTFWCWGWSDEG